MDFMGAQLLEYPQQQLRTFLRQQSLSDQEGIHLIRSCGDFQQWEFLVVVLVR
jgi:hypothetical protein